MIDEASPSLHTPRVTFVVVNWNQCQLTLDCLASLYQQKYPNFDIILVDNGSSDDSVLSVRATFPNVTIIENGKNLGIATANNVGIRHALSRESEYIFLLNNDTTVDPEMLNLLVAAAESNDSIGASGPTMLYHSDPEVIWCSGNRVDWRTGSTFRLRENEPLDSVEGSPIVDVDFITSCAVCIKRDVFRTVGLMDDRYFIYYDEADFFARSAALGWRTVYVPSALMWHKVSATMGETSPGTEYYMTRNRILFISKNLSSYLRFRALAWIALRTVLAIAAYSVKSHNGRRTRNRNAKLRGLCDAVMGRWGAMP